MMEGGQSGIERLLPLLPNTEKSYMAAPLLPESVFCGNGGDVLSSKPLLGNHQNDRWTALSLARRVTQPSSLASNRSKSSGFVR